MKEPDDESITKLLRQLVERATGHAVMLVRPDGTTLWCNTGAERLFAASREALVGHDIARIFTEEDIAAGIDRLERKIASSDAIAEDDRWHVRADGSRFWSSGAMLPLADAHGDLVAFGKILRDRTDLKTQLGLLANQVEHLRETDGEKDRAITTLVHELRNIFAGLQGSVELLDRPIDDPARREKFAALMRQQLAVAQRLTDDLLDVKRAQQNKVAIRLEPLIVQEELRALAANMESRLQAAGLTLQLLAPPADVVVDADRVRFQQIFGNLLENAIKFTPPEGRIWLKVTTEDRCAVMHVEDTGRGIPTGMLQKIFELFTQVDTSSSKGGLGVGLALVRELVLLHHGSVQATSKGPGEGSEFSVRLPLREPRVSEG